MKLYHIKINGKYFAGVDSEKTYKSALSGGGWRNYNDSTVNVINFTEDETQAYEIGGALNLKSYIDKMITAERDNYIDIKKMEIIQVKEAKEPEPQKVYYVEYSGVYSYEFEFFKNQKNAEKRVEELKQMGDDGAYYKEVLLKDREEK